MTECGWCHTPLFSQAPLCEECQEEHDAECERILRLNFGIDKPEDYTLKVGSQVRCDLSTGVPGHFTHRPFKVTGTVDALNLETDYALVYATDGHRYLVHDLNRNLRVIGN